MALNGEGEPQPTLMQVATQAATIELFTQWQTYRNGVHMDWDTFRSIDFRAIAVAVLTGAGFSVTAVEAALKLPQLSDADLGEPSDAYVKLAHETGRDHLHRAVAYPQVGTKEWDEHMRQVQG